MRDLTKWFLQNKPEVTGEISRLLLSIAANVPAYGGVALVGGYLRDVYFGYPAKDKDFVFYGLSVAEFKTAFDMWMRRLPHGSATWEVFGEDYNGAEQTLIPCVIKVNLDGSEIDFILYNVQSLTEVLTNFDHSLNEFSAVYDSEFRFSIAHRQGWGVCTRNANTTCTDERAARMQELARQIDWEYVA